MPPKKAQADFSPAMTSSERLAAGGPEEAVPGTVQHHQQHPHGAAVAGLGGIDQPQPAEIRAHCCHLKCAECSVLGLLTAPPDMVPGSEQNEEGAILDYRRSNFPVFITQAGDDPQCRLPCGKVPILAVC